MGWSSQSNVQPAANRYAIPRFRDKVSLSLSVVKVLSPMSLACGSGPEHPTSPPAYPTAPPPTFTAAKGK